MVANPKFWKGKKVFLTGHTGFKGGWLALWLRALGANVIGYALNPPSGPSLCRVAHIQKKFVSIRGDVRDRSLLFQSLKKHRPEIVFHLAAQAYLSEGYRDPYGTYTTNVLGTLNLFESCRILGSVRTLINVTTDKVYEDRNTGISYRESDRLGGTDPYSNSKACSDFVTRVYADSYFNETVGYRVSAAMARAGNVIGGGDWSVNRIIPDCVRAWIKKKPVHLRRPKAIRPWQHVLNPLSGYLRLAERLYSQPQKYSGAWNFGPANQDCRPVIDVVRKFAREWHGPSDFKILKTATFKESMNLQLSSAKAKKFLDWKPIWGLDRALEKTAEWYEAFASGRSDLEKVCESQISEFMAESQ